MKPNVLASVYKPLLLYEWLTTTVYVINYQYIMYYIFTLHNVMHWLKFCPQTLYQHINSIIFTLLLPDVLGVGESRFKCE